MHDCYQNVWKGTDFHPVNFLDMVWRHVPGEEFNLGISCQVQARTEYVEKLFDVQIFKRKGSALIPEQVFRGQSKRSLTNNAVTDLLTRIAKALFPSTLADKQYIQLAVDSAGNAVYARFLGFAGLVEQGWKQHLLPNFADFQLEPGALYQIYLKPAEVEIIKITKTSMDGWVKESGSDFSLVRVFAKGLLAVPGCYDLQTPLKLVRSVFIEVSADS